MGPLSGKVAVVTGASRGAGKGVALGLGEKGATVYCTGRTVRGGPKPRDGAAGTVEDTAEAVTAAGGAGIPVHCDHTDSSQVEALFQRVVAEQGGQLDILVNAAWGGNDLPIEPGTPFWQLPSGHWASMFDGGVQPTIITCCHAVPLMLHHKQGLIVHVSFWDDNKYLQHLYYDAAKATINRLAFSMARELTGPHGVAVVGLSPGWMRTERVLAAFNATAEDWQRHPELAGTESPLYLGRGVAALAGDAGGALELSGGVVRVVDLAHKYGFVDEDGRQPVAFHMLDD